jgi:hypothetical protein
LPILFSQPIPQAGHSIEKALSRKGQSKMQTRGQRNAAQKSPDEQNWNEPAKNSVREKRKTQKASKRVEILGMIE